MSLDLHRLYVVRFTDDRVKIGISANVKKRMSYYAQEARRNDVDGIVWWASSAFTSKEGALLAERVMCRAYKEHAIAGHREWIRANCDGFKNVIESGEELRSALGDEVGSGSYGYRFGLAGAAQ